MWQNWNYSIFILMILKYGVYMLNRDNYCMSHAPILLHAMTWSQFWDKRQCQVRANMIITQDFIKYLCPKSVPWVINQQMKIQTYSLTCCVHQSVFLLRVTVSPQKMTWYQTRAEGKVRIGMNMTITQDLTKHCCLGCTLWESQKQTHMITLDCIKYLSLLCPLHATLGQTVTQPWWSIK